MHGYLDERALKVLSQDSNFIEVANFRWQKHFYRARIPLKGLKSLSYVVVDLNVKQTAKLTLYVSHTELRMQMDPLQPVQLYSQFDSASTQVEHEVRDFLISYNYMARKRSPMTQ